MFSNKQAFSNTSSNLQDPYWPLVVFFHKFDGTYSDQTENNVTITPRVYSVISTSTYKWGTGSITSIDPSPTFNLGRGWIFDIGTSYEGMGVGLNNYTFECWWYHTPDTSPKNKCILKILGNDLFYLYRNPSNTLFYPARQDTSSNIDIANTLSVPYDQWSHICWTRSGGTCWMGVNGVLQQVRTNDTYNMLVDTVIEQNAPRYGWFADANFASTRGFIDSGRFTANVARYTGSSYIVPTSDFPVG